ncbi:MAG: hypothetical protein ABEH83_11420 [Halobacterium sp.]
MSRSSARRAQVEPLAAVVAVAVVCFAVGAYATVRADVLGPTTQDAPADQVLADAVDAATGAGSVVVAPTKLDIEDVAPEGYTAAVTVTAGDREWTAGPSPPPDTATATKQVPVRVAPDTVRPGRLTVEVWS